MQLRHHLLRLTKGVQAETSIYFVVWWILFEYSNFDHFPKFGKNPEKVPKTSFLGVVSNLFPNSHTQSGFCHIFILAYNL